MLENVNLRPVGVVSIFAIDREGNQRLLLTKNNSLAPEYRTIIVNNMVNTPNSFLDYVGIYMGLSILATVRPTLVPLTTVGGPYTAQVQAIFPVVGDPTAPPGSEFSGGFDNLKLGNSTFGDFSVFTLPSGQVITKDPDEQILIQWNLNFI